LRYRRHLVETLYAIANLPREQGSDGSAAELTMVTHTALAQLDPLANGLLEEWLKNGEISPEEATSMMNDTAYVRRITENLLTAARALGEATQPPHTP
jgi:phosphate:Na+ symporter